MDVKDIEKTLIDALQAPDDPELRIRYGDAITEHLKDKRSTGEIVSIVIRGIDIDRAANYYDYLERASKNDLQSVWKQVRESKEAKRNTDNHTLKFLAGALALAFMKAGNMESQCGTIMTMMVAMINAKNRTIPVNVYGPILRDYILDDLDPKTILPRWETIKASEEVVAQFAQILLAMTEEEHAEEYKTVRQWAARGASFAEEQLKKKKIEEKIPKSRVSELMDIVEHYKVVEQLIRDSVYEAVKREEEINGLHQQIASLNEGKRNLEETIRTLNDDISKKQQLLDKAEKEVGERAAINEAFGALKKNDERSLLNDIAIELRAEYQDFVESESEEMDVLLGEIYREKVRNIFKILSKKGIKME